MMINCARSRCSGVLHLKRYDALTSFQHALAIEPHNVDVLANIGFIYSERGKDEEAEKLLRRAIAIEPKHFPANYDLGRLLVRLRRYEEAVRILERAADDYVRSRDSLSVVYGVFSFETQSGRGP